MQTHTHTNILNHVNYLYILQEFLLGDTLEKNPKVHNLGALDKKYMGVAGIWNTVLAKMSSISISCLA